jgi:hypothetical protein
MILYNKAKGEVEIRAGGTKVTIGKLYFPKGSAIEQDEANYRAVVDPQLVQEGLHSYIHIFEKYVMVTQAILDVAQCSIWLGPIGEEPPPNWWDHELATP